MSSYPNADHDKDLDRYMALPYVVEVSHDEDDYFARVEDLPGCSTHTGPDGTPGELFELIEDAKRGWITDALERGDPVPEPRSTESYFGQGGTHDAQEPPPGSRPASRGGERFAEPANDS